MSDPDDDNIVRYGTQLEPFEEDRTCAMLEMNPNLSNLARKRFRILLSLNINFHKAQELCPLPWTEICKIIPEMESMPNPFKKNKKKHNLRVKLSQELQQTEHRPEEPDEAPYWHDPGDARQISPDRSQSPHNWGSSCHNEQSYLPNEYEITKEAFSHQRDRLPQIFSKKSSRTSHRNHREEAGQSHARVSESNRRTRRPSERESNWEPPLKFANAPHADRGESYRGRDRSPRTRNRSPIARTRSPRMRDHSPRMRNCSPRMRDRTPRMRDCSPRMRYHSHRMSDRSPGIRDRSPIMRDRSPRTRHSSPIMRNHSPRTRHSSPIMRNHSPRMRDRSPRKRDYSPRARFRHDPIPMACSSKDSYERTQLKYIDANDALQVEAQNRMRAVKHHYNEKDDVQHFSDRPYKVQKTSSEGCASFNYWSESDRPSRLGLRNEMHPPNHASTYSYSEDKKFREDPKNYQKITWENNVNHDYRESDRPSRNGLRNQTHPIETICIEDSDDEYNGPIYEPHTPVDDGNEQFDFSAAYRTEPKSEKEFHWDQASEPLETVEDKGANADKDAIPIPVVIRNITPMTETEMTLVHQSINQAIVQIGVQGAGPKFLGSTFKTGRILMLCENQKSRKWLEKKVPTLKPWPEASLSVSLQGKQTGVSILILDKEGITPSTALELLRVQNPGLNTVNWKVTRIVKTHSGQIVFLSVDKASFAALKLINFKANLGMDKVSFWVQSKHRRTRAGKTRRLLLSSEKHPPNHASTYSCSGDKKSKEDPKNYQKVPLLPTPIAYTMEQNKDSNSCLVVSNPLAVVKKRHQHPKKPRLSLNQTIDTKPSQLLTQIKESKSPPAETWTPKADQSFGFNQSFNSSDWTTW